MSLWEFVPKPPNLLGKRETGHLAQLSSRFTFGGPLTGVCSQKDPQPPTPPRKPPKIGHLSSIFRLKLTPTPNKNFTPNPLTNLFWAITHPLHSKKLFFKHL